MKSKINVLFMSPSSEVGGAEKVLLDILTQLNKDKYNFILLNQGEGDFTQAFKAAGGETVSFKLPAWRKQKCFFSRYISLLRVCLLIKRKNISLVHCNAYRLAPYLKWIERLNVAPGLVHVHDLLTKRKAEKFDTFEVKNIVAVSDAVASVFRANGKKIDVICNGVDTKKFKNEHDLKDHKLCVGMLAHFHPIKRHNLFVDIATELKIINPNVNFLLVGDDLVTNDKSLNKCKEYAANMGIADDITFTGRVNNPEYYMSQMDIFLLTSKEEACPLVVLEAMASGCVVVADKNAGGTCSLISDGEDGFLIDCFDVTNSARKINEIAKNRDLINTIVTNAQKKIEKRFTFEVFTRNIDTLYDRLLSNKSEVL